MVIQSQTKTSYPAKSFKLDTNTIKQLTELKKELNLSWNLFFLDLIKNYDRGTTKTTSSNLRPKPRDT